MATITLPPALELAITQEAQRQGTTLEILALDKLTSSFLSALPAPPDDNHFEGESLADFLGDFIGCLDSGEFVPGGARMSENTGEKFAEGMLAKHDAGHL